MLIGYFDESARGEADEPMCVAGYIFKPVDYKRFCRRWRTVLRFRGRQFSHFHMTELYSGKGEYRGLSMTERAEILSNAVDAITPNFYAGIAVHFDQKAFERAAPDEWLRYFGSIYASACQMCLQVAGFWMDEKRSFVPIKYVFEDGHKLRAQVDALLNGIGGHELSRRQYRYRGHEFRDKRDDYGLQAADLLAWTLTKAKVGGSRATMRPFLPSVVRLANNDNGRYRIQSFTGALLERFFDEQVRGKLEIIVNAGPRKRTFR